MKIERIYKWIISILSIIIVGLIILVMYMSASIKSNINNQNTNNTESNTSTETNNSSSGENSVEKKETVTKEQILSYYKELISKHKNTDHTYSVTDINNDGIPELLIFITEMQSNNILAETTVYTYSENKGTKENHYIVAAGVINGRLDTNTSLYKMNDGKLLSVYGKMGFEETTYYALENDTIVKKGYAERETEDYITGDVILRFKSCADTSLIDNFN